MAKACWKCGEYHQNNTTHCPFCGASLEGGDKDLVDNLIGLFTFQEEDGTKINPRTTIAAVLIIAVAAVALFVIIDEHNNRDPLSDVDCRYNYELYFENPLRMNDGTLKEPSAGYKYVVVKLKFLNCMESGTITNLLASWETQLYYGDTVFLIDLRTTTNYLEFRAPAEFNPTEYGYQFFVFSVFDSIDDVDKLEANFKSPGHSIGHDPSIDVNTDY